MLPGGNCHSGVAMSTGCRHRVCRTGLGLTWRRADGNGQQRDGREEMRSMEERREGERKREEKGEKK